MNEVIKKIERKLFSEIVKEDKMLVLEEKTDLIISNIKLFINDEVNLIKKYINNK